MLKVIQIRLSRTGATFDEHFHRKLQKIQQTSFLLRELNPKAFRHTSHFPSKWVETFPVRSPILFSACIRRHILMYTFRLKKAVQNVILSLIVGLIIKEKNSRIKAESAALTLWGETSVRREWRQPVCRYVRNPAALTDSDKLCWLIQTRGDRAGRREGETKEGVARSLSLWRD